ncbi:MAG: PTS glucose transporter subunit IIA [Clostridia bacterium]|nr:PTS glucose transporter subunit IIA [Clostridia bacterium]
MGLFDKIFGKKLEELGAPVAGEAVASGEVNDPTFGEEMLGKGMAIKPACGRVVAPCDATVDMMFETGHAVSLTTESGVEMLIHVGLDTVNLQGKHYTVHCQAGDKVKKGQLLIEFDKDAIAAEGYDTITPVVVCNSDDFGTFETVVGKVVAEGDAVIKLAK